MAQKYPNETILVSEDEEFRVIDYEKSESADNDDHYEVCFDEELNLTIWTKQSYLDKMKLK